MKKVDSPIELANLVPMGRQAHGRNLWKETPSGKRELVFFDRNTMECVSPTEFEQRQQQRARARARNYPKGRKKVSSHRRADSFLW